MKTTLKIRLDLGALRVDSFTTDGARGTARGTVRALSGGMVVTEGGGCDTQAVDSRVAGCTQHVLLCVDYTTPQYCPDTIQQTCDEG